jgi:TPR repeat protein
VLTNFTGGDALIATEQEVLFVMEFGRAFADEFRTNAVLVREGTKSFKSPSGDYLQAEAFTNAGLSKEEIRVLQKVTKACLTEALFPTPTNALPKVVSEVKKPVNPPRPKGGVRKTEISSAEEEFQAHLMMAKDNSPYMQFLLAKDYLEGIGTAKDETLGLEWMERAAKNGSGDAKRYLEERKDSR